MDDDREPSFFTGLNSSDVVAIGIALMFSLGGPLSDRARAVRAAFVRACHPGPDQGHPSGRSTQDPNHGPYRPGEVAVGISAGNPPKK
jgi:hypothetical protein